MFIFVVMFLVVGLVGLKLFEIKGRVMLEIMEDLDKLEYEEVKIVKV